MVKALLSKIGILNQLAITPYMQNMIEILFNLLLELDDSIEEKKTHHVFVESKLIEIILNIVKLTFYI